MALHTTALSLPCHDMTEPSEGTEQEPAPPRAVAEASHEERVQDGYYIYGLVDPRALRDRRRRPAEHLLRRQGPQIQVVGARAGSAGRPHARGSTAGTTL